MYLTAVGYVLVEAGIVIKNTENNNNVIFNDIFEDLLEAYDVLFAGGLLITFFWVSKIMQLHKRMQQ